MNLRLQQNWFYNNIDQVIVTVYSPDFAASANLLQHKTLSKNLSRKFHSGTSFDAMWATDCDILVLKLISVLVFILFSSQNFYFI